MLNHLDITNADSTLNDAAELNSVDYESIITTTATAAMDEESISNDVNDLNRHVNLIVSIESQIQSLTAAATADDGLSKMAIGIALGALRQDATRLLGSALGEGVDAEALDNDVVRAAVAEAEAISDTLKKAWETLKQFIAKVLKKIKQLATDIVLWAINGEKEASALIKTISDYDALKTDVKLDKVKESIGSRLATLSIDAGEYKFSAGKLFSASRKELTDMSKGVNGKASMSAVDTIVLDALKKNKSSFIGEVPMITNEHFIRVTRYDGSKLRFAVGTEIDGVTGYEKYVKLTVSDKAIKSITLAAVPALSEIKTILTDAVAISKSIAKTKDALYKEMIEVDKEVSGDIENLKFKDGIFKLAWTKTLGSKSLEQLTADEKVAAVRTKSSFVSTYTSDVLFGLNAQVKEAIGVSKIFLGQYDKKKK